MFPIFTTAWALAILFHLTTFQGAKREPISVLLFAAALAAIFFPAASLSLLSLALLQVAQFWARLPRAQTSEYLKALCGICMVATYVSLTLPRATLQVDSAAWLASFAPLLRLLTSLMFAASVLHKLNWSFLNPRTSDATVIINPLLTALRLPSPAWVQASFPYVTILVEGFIGIGLLFPATRLPAILVLMVFAFAIGVRGVVQFSWLMDALALLFLDERLCNSLAALAASPSRRAAFGAGCCIFFAVALAVRKQGYPPFLVAGASLVSMFALVVVSRAAVADVPVAWSGSMFPLSAQQVVLLAFFCLNELGPYVGYKDWPVFRMYSNLESGTDANHLFLGRLFFNPFFKQRDEVLLCPSTLELLAHEARDGIDYYLPYSSLAAIVPKLSRPTEYGRPVEYVRRDVRLAEKAGCICRREKTWLDFVLPARFFYHFPSARPRGRAPGAPPSGTG
jgi:hypothetical protein